MSSSAPGKVSAPTVNSSICAAWTRDTQTRKTLPVPGPRVHGELVAEQLAQPLDDRQAHAEALAAIALGVGDLVELGEHLGQLVLG